MKKELKLLPVIEGSHATHLKITLNYNKGGMNYFTYKDEQRGIYLGVSPVKIEKKEGYSTESFMVLKNWFWI